MKDVKATETIVTTSVKKVSWPKKVEELLNNLYRDIWLEACYDPDTEDSKKFARKLLPHIQALNDILKFKE